jgi:predicted outer membrane protein
MSEELFDDMRQGVLDHIQELFDEIEAEMVMSHQEKYALLEDAFAGAFDEDELKVAFEQWYKEHSEDLELEHSLEELWEHATAVDEDEE